MIRRMGVAAAAALGLFLTEHAEANTEIYDRLLARYVVEGADGVNRVRYSAWHSNGEDRGALDAYVMSLERERPSRLLRDEQFAYWVNLYNAVTLQIVLENYPVRSIRNIRSRGTLDPRGLIGPWWTKRVTVEGRRLNLDEIENAILRREFDEPRVHYAVNCASIGCPNLMARAWRADTLDADLDAAARAYINHPRGISVGAGGRVTASRIFDWYDDDFGGDARGVLAHVRLYATPALRSRLEGASTIANYEYDWALNGAG